jgi:hypothetical protein
MTILIIGIALFVGIFILGFIYKNRKKNETTQDNLEDFSFPAGVEVPTSIKKKSELTPMEKATAVKTLEKMGYEKVEIIKLLGEDVYDN